MSHAHTNRLARETSPYLLQHQHNPVDWYPWGPEAIEAARTQNKPIFLSVGYSTCYWCHVMERQCFENEAIAAEMNRLFINIKVDREERPDVDQLYMTAVQVLTRQGGWPMSVFLLPDLRPFYGGTYFPPTDGHGRPGFPTLLRALEDAYRNRRPDVEKTAAQLRDILGELAQPSAATTKSPLNAATIESMIDRSTADYDAEHGGFGRAPKFPRETLLELLLVRDRHAPDARRQSMIRHSLDAMANGGIRDHLGGGFHRYSTDARWLVPHFEIMLYDNALLAWAYAEAFRQFGDARYATIARGICDFVLREMTDPAGGFYTALDAEVDAQEGMPYLWTAQEIEDELGPTDAELFNRVYGLADGPNFADPHNGNGIPDKNVLFLADGPALESDPRIVAMRQKLYAARRQRKQPLLDTKILTSWNALMIRALAFCGEVLDEPRYVKAAAAAADFLLQHHADGHGGLLRTSRDGAAKYAAFLDDYAYLAQALLGLAKASGDNQRRVQADTIAREMIERFGDSGAGGFFFTDAAASELLVRQKIGTDSPLPSGNGIAAITLLELGHTTVARAVVDVFADQLQANCEGMSAMVLAAFVLAGSADSATTAPSPTAISPPDDELVSVRAEWADPQVARVLIEIAAGYHIASADPGPGMTATHLSVSEVAAKVEYPSPTRIQFAFADQPLAVYQGRVELLVRFASAPAAPVRLALRYQACTDRACLAAVTRSIQLSPGV